MENQRRIDLARYRNELLKKQRDLQFENERNRINSLTQLTEADYKNIENDILILPDRYAPVSESLHAIMSAAVPVATTSPPFLPAPGPISTI